MGALGLGLALLPAGCNLSSSNSSGGMIGTAGDLMEDPASDALFFVDPNEGGAASRIRLVEMFWGRQVDVYGLDVVTGEPELTPRFPDLVINENIQSNSEYQLETNPITQEQRLIVQQPAENLAGDANPVFINLVRALVNGVPPIQAKDDDGSDSAPFSFIARNSTLVLRFDDLLDDSAMAEADLPFTVQLLQGYPPTIPFSPRMMFDKNHGGLRGDSFHSTRVLIDMTITEAELAELPTALPVNSLGLAPSLLTTDQPNVSVRIPTQEFPAVGQFSILRSVTQKPVAFADNGPADQNGTTRPIVRAMRSGNETDQNNGFALDLNSPEIIGEWPVVVSNPIGLDLDGEGLALAFSVRVNFQSLCKDDAEVGDILQLGSVFLEVLQPNGLAGGSNNQLNDLQVRSLSGRISPVDVQGSASFLSTFDPSLFANEGNQCWLSFTPLPSNNQITPDTTIQVRFSEPMDPLSVLPFDTMILVEGAVSEQEPGAQDIIVADISASADLQRFVLQPLLPIAQPTMHLRLLGDVDGVSDLAGNSLAAQLPFVPLDVVGTSGIVNGGFVLRFDEVDELTFGAADGNNDLRGQFFYDLERGVILPRPVTRTTYVADRIHPVTSAMTAFPPGVQTPISPLGSKLMTVWRYCDFGFNVTDESVYNIDVEGINWAPIGGQVVADFYTDFEMRLAHSNRLPDEVVDLNLLPSFIDSGLRGAGQQYAQNVASNVGALDSNVNTAQRVMHPRALGYQINPVNLFLESSGTSMIPFPLNEDDALAKKYYTWRDTSMTVKTAPNGAGIPLAIEADNNTIIGDAFIDLTLDLYPGVQRGSVAGPNRVPSIGLPLLMEYRCYPSNTGIGLNAFDVSLAITSSARPNFRAFSTGGTNAAGVQVFKDPDLELTPTGGFNPQNNGQPTAQVADNTFYIGSLDSVARLSMVHTIWLDAGLPAAWVDPVFEPRPEDQPTGTQVRFDYRGATGITPLNTALDAELLDMYGNRSTNFPTNQGITFTTGNEAWVRDLNLLDGSRFVQVRMSFINNVDTGLSPELSSFGFAYEQN